MAPGLRSTYGGPLGPSGCSWLSMLVLMLILLVGARAIRCRARHQIKKKKKKKIAMPKPTGHQDVKEEDVCAASASAV